MAVDAGTEDYLLGEIDVYIIVVDFLDVKAQRIVKVKRIVESGLAEVSAVKEEGEPMSAHLNHAIK